MVLGEKKSEREEGLFHIKKTQLYHIWAHFTGFMKTAYRFIKPLSSYSRDSYFLVIVNITINIILAAAQIYNFARLGSVTIQWLGASEEQESCSFFIYTLDPASVTEEVRGLSQQVFYDGLDLITHSAFGLS